MNLIYSFFFNGTFRYQLPFFIFCPLSTNGLRWRKMRHNFVPLAFQKLTTRHIFISKCDTISKASICNYVGRNNFIYLCIFFKSATQLQPVIMFSTFLTFFDTSECRKMCRKPLENVEKTTNLGKIIFPLINLTSSLS